MKDQPKVSVIMTVYNMEQFISEAIESALNQTYKNIEIIVVNDGSTDKSEEKIMAYKDRIKYLYRDHKGVSAGFNAAIRSSSGELVAFLDADDAWLPNKIEAQVDYFRGNPDVGLVYTYLYIKNESGDLGDLFGTVRHLTSEYRALHEMKDDFLSIFLRKNNWPPTVAMVKREALEQAGYFNEKLRGNVDYDLWLRVADKFKVGHVAQPLAIYRIHHFNFSRLDEVKSQFEDLSVIDYWAKERKIGKKIGYSVLNERYRKAYRILAWEFARRGDPKEERGYLRKIAALQPLNIYGWIDYLWHFIPKDRRSALAWYYNRLMGTPQKSSDK